MELANSVKRRVALLHRDCKVSTSAVSALRRLAWVQDSLGKPPVARRACSLPD